jgi:hypothetical protein
MDGYMRISNLSISSQMILNCFTYLYAQLCKHVHVNIYTDAHLYMRHKFIHMTLTNHS